MSLPAPETMSNCNIGSRPKQYPEVISQEREPIKTRHNWEPKEDRSSRGVHYSPHIRSRDYKDDQQIIERNTIGKIYIEYITVVVLKLLSNNEIQNDFIFEFIKFCRSVR